MILRSVTLALMAAALGMSLGCDPVLPLRGEVLSAPAPISASDTSIAIFSPTLDGAVGQGLPGARIVLFQQLADAMANDTTRRKGQIISTVSDSTGRFATQFLYTLIAHHRYYLWVGAPGRRPAVRQVTGDSLAAGFLRVVLVPAGTP